MRRFTPPTPPEPFNKVNEDNVFGRGKGRMFEIWIQWGFTFTVNAATNVCTAAAGQYMFDNDQAVRLTTETTLPDPLAINTTYYVINRTDTTCKLSTTMGGDAIDITDTGTGAHTMTRYNGHATDDLIEDPAGIVESLLREECFVERDLTIDADTSDSTFDLDKLRFSTDDYYNNSIVVNATQHDKDYVTDYDGANKRISTSATQAAWALNDNVYLTNVRGYRRINAATFDIVGNTTDGLRKDWLFARSIYNEASLNDLISSVLYESRCVLFNSYDKYKIVALDAASSANTWTNPMKIGGVESVFAGLTSIRQLYNDYRINYCFDYGAQEYKKTLFVNKAGFSASLTNGSTYKTTCKTLYDNYGVINKYEYNCDWIYADDTAELFFDKIFAWYSKQRMIVNWAGDIGNYITYEVGDQVILNYIRAIPTGINNVSKFMIMGNPIKVQPGGPFINFSLIEIS